MFMSGPLLTGYTQTINDYYDREIDAINEPNRPIPSGAACCLHPLTTAAPAVMHARPHAHDLGHAHLLSLCRGCLAPAAGRAP